MATEDIKPDVLPVKQEVMDIPDNLEDINLSEGISNKVKEEHPSIKEETAVIELPDLEEETLLLEFIYKENNLVEVKEAGKDVKNDIMLSMTKEEMHSYLERKVNEYYNQPEINPLHKHVQWVQEAIDELKEIQGAILQINSAKMILQRDQKHFLKYHKVLPKVPTCDIGASADFPDDQHVLNINRSVSNPQTQPSVSASGNIMKNLLIANKNNVSSQSKSNTPISQVNNNSTSILNKKILQKPMEEIEVVDLTDDTPSVNDTVSSGGNFPKHPVPLPARPYSLETNLQRIPPKPTLKVTTETGGISLQWDIPPPHNYAKIELYEIYGYQEVSNAPANTLLWKFIGPTKPLVLPMACTLTQFVPGFRYHFSVRSKDVYNRYSHFADPISVLYTVGDPISKK